MKKLIALLLATAMCLGFVACGDKDNPEATTTESTTAPSDTAAIGADDTTAPPQTDADGSTLSTTTTTAPPQTDADGSTLPTTTAAPTTTDQYGSTAPTTPPPTNPPVDGKVNGLIPPVNGSVAEIVAFYNAAANATKAAPRVKLEKYDTTQIIVEKFLVSWKWVMELITNALADVQTDREKYTETFVNGKGTESEGRTIKKFLPVTGQDYMSALKPEAVKSASCVKKGSGWEIKIVLKEETAGIVSPAPQHGSCMDTLEMVLNPNDLDPQFAVEPGAMATYQLPGKSQFEGKGEDYSLCASVNASGKLDNYQNYMPCRLVGKVKVKGFGPFDLTLAGYFKTEIRFSW